MGLYERQLSTNQIIAGLHPDRVVRLPASMRDDDVYIVPAGIGDIAWAYAKICHSDRPVVLAIADHSALTGANGLSLRAVPFAGLLKNVKYASIALCTSEQVVWASAQMNPAGPLPKSPAYLCVNHWLEQGQKLDSFMGLPTNRHFEMIQPVWADKQADLFTESEKKYIGVFCSSTDYCGKENMPLAEWLRLIRLMLQEKPDHEVVMVGAPWDLSLMLPLWEALNAIGYGSRVQMVYDRDIAVTLAILRRCDFFVGAVAGLSIVAEYQRIPTVHLYSKHHWEKYPLINTWESPEMVGAGLSLSVRMEDGVGSIVSNMTRKFAPFKP